jgi:hypothetical protein
VSLFRNGGVTRYRVDHDVAEEVDRVVINAEHERPDCGGLQPKNKPYLMAGTIGAELDAGRLIGGGAVLHAASSDAQPVGYGSARTAQNDSNTPRSLQVRRSWPEAAQRATPGHQLMFRCRYR